MPEKTLTNLKHKARLAACAAALLASPVLAQAQDMRALVNGHIYTGNSKAPWAEAVIIEDGRFSFVGSTEDAQAQLPDGAKTRDLKGQTVLPGLIDSHVHPLGAGEELLYYCNFDGSDTAAVLAAVEDCATRFAPGSWIQGGAWGPGLERQTDLPASEFLARLDAVSGDHPVILRDFSNHNVLLNSKAMELGKLSEQDLSSFGDLIVRDENGNLSGFFIEGASGFARQVVPARTDAELRQALLTATEALNKLGVTAVKDSYASKAEVTTYIALANAGELPVHAALSIGWRPAMDRAEFEALVAAGEGVDQVDTRFAKIAIDGIPPTKTAAFLDPYLPVEENETGFLVLTPEELTDAIVWMDGIGVSVQAHSVGDWAVRVNLDAVEAARKANGDSGIQHDIAHACLISDADIPRFKELGVAPNFSPMIWYPGPITDGMIYQLLGEERMRDFCPALTMTTLDAHPTAGSDWPVVPAPDPWAGLEALVTRAAPDGSRADEVLAEAEKLSLEQALALFTINGARALRREDSIGSIEVGKFADLIVINQDIFAIDPAGIGDTKVLETLFKGETVYSAEEVKLTEAVTKVAEAYAQGTYTADIDLLKSIFHPKAIMAGDLPSGPVFTDPQAFFDDLASRPSMKEAGDPYQSKIEYLDVTGNTASVTLSETGFFGALEFVNYLSMVHQDGKWQIVSKTFTVK